VNGEAAGHAPSIGASGLNRRRRELDGGIRGAVEDLGAEHASLNFSPLVAAQARIEDLEIRGAHADVDAERRISGDHSTGKRRSNDMIVGKSGEQSRLVDEDRQRRTINVDRTGFGSKRCRCGTHPERQCD